MPIPSSFSGAQLVIDGTVYLLRYVRVRDHDIADTRDALDSLGDATRPGVVLHRTSFEAEVLEFTTSEAPAGIDSRAAAIMAGYDGRSGETLDPVVIESDRLLWRRIDAAIGPGPMSVALSTATGVDLDAFAAENGLSRRSTGLTTSRSPKKEPPQKTALDQVLEDEAV